MSKDAKEYIWQDRKRTFFGLPWSFTKYKLTQEKLIISSGFLSKKEEEIRLYRFLDLTLHRSLGERILGIGTIRCHTADRSSPEFCIKRIKNSEEIKNRISDMIEEERGRKNVVSREFIDTDNF